MNSPAEKRFHQLTLAIQKAINTIETPVKEKHVRSTLIGTFQEQSAVTYWMVAIRLPLQENRIAAWKFCHVTHKVLREGHPACLDDSQRHIAMIENLGKLWVHLREGYGKLVNLYCTLLVGKLRFHARNPQFPGNMQLTSDELDAIAENDVNNYFQLCVELFDYMDDILNLQAAVFDSLGNARANSMTASGQCRLAALIPCAQDSSQIYDCNVRLLFRLHAALPPDTLTGHRERFRQQFKKLSSFYKHASSLQYYRNLLTLPLLPSNPPNFLIQSDFGTYVTPVVSIPEPLPDEMDTVGALIDTSDTFSQSTPDHLDVVDSRTTPSPQLEQAVEQDRHIEHLMSELRRTRDLHQMEMQHLVQERNSMLESMRDHCTQLETQLQAVQRELEMETKKTEFLAVQNPELTKKLSDVEEKAKVTDEKFQKLKGAYTQLREEHIMLIRQKAEVDKAAMSLRAAAAQHESAKALLQQQLNDRVKDVELLQQSSSTSDEIEVYKSEISKLRTDLELAMQKETEFEGLRASMAALEIEHKTSATEAEEKINNLTSEIKDLRENLDQIRKESEEKESELTKVKNELTVLKEKSGEEYSNVVQEKEAALQKINLLTEQHNQEKQERDEYINMLKIDLNKLEKKLSDVEHFELEHRKLIEEISNKSTEFDHVIHQKDLEIDEIKQHFLNSQEQYIQEKTILEEELQSRNKELDAVREELVVLKQYKNKVELQTEEITTNNSEIVKKLEAQITERKTLDELLSQKTEEIAILENKIKSLILEQDESTLNAHKNNEKHVELSLHATQLEEIIVKKDAEINSMKEECKGLLEANDRSNKESNEKIREYQFEIRSLNERIQSLCDGKDVVITNLKSMLKEKDEILITLNVDVKKLSEELAKLKEELEEKSAELEIANNELFNLTDEYDSHEKRNDDNLYIKNQELRELNDKIKKLTEENTTLLSEKVVILKEKIEEKEELTKEIEMLKENLFTSTFANEEIQKSKQEVLTGMEEEIRILRDKLEQTESDKQREIQKLKDLIEKEYEGKIREKVDQINELESKLCVSESYSEAMHSKDEHIEELIANIAQKEEQAKILEERIDRGVKERLRIECELQDLLQHNTSLEEALAAIKKQLEETQVELAKQRSSVVSHASSVAAEVVDGAMAALERSSAHESGRHAGQGAVAQLAVLAAHAEVDNNEQKVSRAALLAAHGSAQLAAYVVDVANVATDAELADKLTNECRTMLTTTKQCMESLEKADGSWAGVAADAKALVQAVSEAAAAADRQAGAARSVDDELADMDTAIEDAANRIEEMLAASRAADTGAKLEVNGAILDACTGLMAAVKVLVREARALQAELGDPATRRRVYRKNPQWAQGLVSAAKAVVFAAKLLVSSADEAVGAAGRVEGVSAAAHEVAGSTAQLVAASRSRAPPAAPALARLTTASRTVAAATGAVVAAVRAASALQNEQEALDTSSLTLTATRRLEMESKVRALELESALEAERVKLAALRKRHYHLAQMEENGNMANGQE